MTRRETAFLLIGLGAGLMMSAAALLEILLSWPHHMFIVGVNWSGGSVLLAVPFLLVVTGFILLYRNRKSA